MEASLTTVPCPATNLSILMCKSSARTKQSVIGVALKTPPEIKLGSVYIKRHFCIDPMTILVSHQAVPPTFYNKIAPMNRSMEFNDAMILCIEMCQRVCAEQKNWGWQCPRMLSVATGPNGLQCLIVFKL